MGYGGWRSGVEGRFVEFFGRGEVAQGFAEVRRCVEFGIWKFQVSALWSMNREKDSERLYLAVVDAPSRTVRQYVAPPNPALAQDLISLVRNRRRRGDDYRYEADIHVCGLGKWMEVKGRGGAFVRRQGRQMGVFLM